MSSNQARAKILKRWVLVSISGLDLGEGRVCVVLKGSRADQTMQISALASMHAYMPIGT